MSTDGLRRTGTAEGHLEGVVEDTPIEEDQGLHGLVLGGGCDVSMRTTQPVRNDWIMGGEVWDRPRMDVPLRRAPLAWQYPPNLRLWQD